MAKGSGAKEACDHERTLSLYRRGARSDGRGFIPDAARCKDCNALLERREAK